MAADLGELVPTMKGENMSERTRGFFEAIKEGAAEAASQIGDEMKRLGVQGAAELGSALFNGNSYVPYGQGQNLKLGKDENEGVDSPTPPQPEQERGGMEM